jgi:hypothetical protein
MVLSLKALILEEINPDITTNRHDSSVNTGRGTIHDVVRCITQEDRSQVSNNIFQRLKNCCQIWEVSLAVRRSSSLF